MANFLITFEGSSLEEIAGHAKTFASKFANASVHSSPEIKDQMSAGPKVPGQVEHQASPGMMATNEKPPVAAAPIPMEKKRGRPAKPLVAAAKEAAPEPVAAAAKEAAPEPVVVAETAPTTAAPASKETAQQMLQALVSSKGVEQAIKVLADLGVKRLGELPESRYGEFIDKCQVILG